MQNFRQILQRLADSGLEFVIVGGYAAVTHGSSLVTRDLDIVGAPAPMGSVCPVDDACTVGPSGAVIPQMMLVCA